MAYQVDKFNGTRLVSVEDGTIDTTTDIRFVGKNYAGYGEVQNENFLHLLENFSNTSAPPKVVTGQIWYDSGNKKLRFYDGSRFRTASGAEIGTTAPSGLQAGDFWFDTSAEQLYAYNGSTFVLIGPETTPELGAASLTAQVVKDTLGTNHSIGKIISGGDTIAIVSKDAFTLDSGLNPITGFTTIKKGLNLVNTNGSTGVTSTDHFYWGTASNAARLGGFLASEYVRTGEVRFDTEVNYSDPGLTIGGNYPSYSKDLVLKIENGDEPIIESRLASPLTLRVRVSASDERNFYITSTGFLPGANNFYNLGSSTENWANVYATTFTGNLSGSVTGNTSGTHTGPMVGNLTGNVIGNLNGTVTGNVIGSVTGTASNALTLNSLNSEFGAVAVSVAIRDASANLTANRFIGIADKSDRLKIDDSATDTDPSYRSAKTLASGNTIAARDSLGNLFAVLFDGTATAAKYADLAEKYLTDREYEPGTVVTVGGEAEVRATVFGDRAIGVVSTNPAFMMNKELEGGTYIALKGRVPCKVVGSVRKGDRLVATENGCAIAASFHQHPDVFGIALQSDQDVGVKTIEVLVL
jgi:hypothetical protein